ncbi:MAG: DUF2250 domain-containing protein [Bacillota bacterium]
MGRSPFFNSNNLSDSEILSTIEKLINDRNQLFETLAKAGSGSDPAISEMAKQFHELDKIYHHFIDLDILFKDLMEIEKVINEDDTESGEDFRHLLAEYTESYTKAAGQLYRMLLDKGYITEEVLDETDMDILKFIEYAGPEYAWRLGINVGIDTREARERIEKLLEKGLLEKVQGTMLEGYHREKDWVKHMNHTYYRLSRKAKLFLRELRRKSEITGKQDI